jgi:hypothetical protein
MTHLLPTHGFKWKHREDAYATHQPVLYEAIRRTEGLPGAIVELGCGFNSTNLIHEIAGKRTVFSIEHDRGWMSKFEHLGTPNRRFILINSWYEIFTHFASETDLSVVFIDHGDWDSRAHCVEFFKNRSDLVVIHDSDYLERTGLLKYKDHYKYVKTFMPLEPYPYMTGPPTTLMSNNADITGWEIDYANYVQ